eukprot:9928561-Lingulodinium_polyedra.AAC.1
MPEQLALLGAPGRPAPFSAYIDEVHVRLWNQPAVSALVTALWLSPKLKRRLGCLRRDLRMEA